MMITAQELHHKERHDTKVTKESAFCVIGDFVPLW